MPELLAGVDEAGRGCLVGAVIAAAVILDPSRPIHGLADSKQLSSSVRARLEREIKSKSLAFALGRAEPSEIDRHNILNASFLAMQRAVAGLRIRPDLVQVDGAIAPVLPYPVRAVVGGDEVCSEISAASILAKVARDREMAILDAFAPGYGIARHKGYPTCEHLKALKDLKASSWHRTSFRPVQEVGCL